MRAALALAVILTGIGQAGAIIVVLGGLDDSPVLRSAQIAAIAVVAAAIVVAFVACIVVRAAEPNLGRSVVREAERYTRKAATVQRANMPRS